MDVILLDQVFIFPVFQVADIPGLSHFFPPRPQRLTISPLLTAAVAVLVRECQFLIEVHPRQVILRIPGDTFQPSPHEFGLADVLVRQTVGDDCV